MKKPSSLAQQIFQAQAVLQSWSAEHRSSLRLEGSDRFLPKGTKDQPEKPIEVKDKKKLAHG
jgi:hypothetical protein